MSESETVSSIEHLESTVEDLQFQLKEIIRLLKDIDNGMIRITRKLNG